MELKLSLNKLAKVDNIENYTLKILDILRQKYEESIEKNNGQDPDFPLVTFGDGNGKKVQGDNIARHEIGEDIESD